MTVRDLGYRAYEGELRPASQNTWVMVRHGLWRIWGSWVNKFVLFFFWIPLLIFIVLAFFRAGLGWGPLDAEVGADEPVTWFRAAPQVWLRSLTGVQYWMFASIVTLRSGASVISEDLNNKAYQFYFAKPVTPIQYLAGRVGALAIWIFFIVFIPTMLLALFISAFSPAELRLEHASLVLPALLDAAVISAVMSVLAVATSALSKSRALTLTAWVLVLFVPFALAALVETIGDAEWAYLISVPGLLWALGDDVYKVARSWDQLSWFHAAPVLVLLTAACGYSALRRIERAEVVT